MVLCKEGVELRRWKTIPLKKIGNCNLVSVLGNSGRNCGKEMS